INGAGCSRCCEPFSIYRIALSVHDVVNPDTYPQYGNGVEIRGNDLVVSKIGRVKVVWHRPIEGTIKTVTLRCSRTGKWYVSFSVEVERERLSPSADIVGVDVGLLSFATLSNGEQIANP